MNLDVKWKCEHCSSIFHPSAVMTAPNPFDPGDGIPGCPKCDTVNSFIALCQFQGCLKETTCGGTHPDGVYRVTCGDHAYFKMEQK